MKPKFAGMCAGAMLVGALGLFAPAAGAATVKVANGIVVFTAASGELNNVSSRPAGNPLTQLTIADSGAPLTAKTGCSQVDAHTATCATPLAALSVSTGDGDDRVSISEFFGLQQLTINGGLGDDMLFAGSGIGFSPVLDAGGGNDRLVVSNNGGGTPVMHGGNGDDSLSIPESGGGRMYGDDGNDTLDFGGSSAAEVHGGYGADHLILSDSNLLSPPTLDGEGGADTYSFPRETRFLPETIVPSSGIDTLDQSAGDFPIDFDMAVCPGCVETVIGSAYDDHIVGDGRAQSIFGGDGADSIDGGGGADVLAGEGGDDSITSRDGVKDSVSCADGADAVTADHRDVVSADCESVDRG